MSKKYPEFDENDQKTKDRLAFLADLNAQTADKMTSWADLYAAMKDKAFDYMQNPSKENADFAVLVLLCFVLALEELPEEGDSMNICRKLNEIMIMHPEKTGAAVFVGKEADAMRAVQQEIMRKMLMPALPVELAMAMGEEEPVTRTVH